VFIPTMAIFLLSITVQHLVWERWVVPLLPLLAIVEAYLANALADQLIQQFNISRTTYVVATAAITLLLALPPIMTGNAQAAERATDTRSLATAWARTHVPPDSSVTIEYLGFDILSQPWRILFPAGDKGCVDVRRNLAGHIEISTIDHSTMEEDGGDWRHGCHWGLGECLTAAAALLRRKARTRSTAAVEGAPPRKTTRHKLAMFFLSLNRSRARAGRPPGAGG